MNRERKVGANYANQHLQQGKLKYNVKNVQITQKNNNIKDNSKVKIFKNLDDIPDLDDFDGKKVVPSNNQYHKFVISDNINEDPFSANNIDDWNESNDRHNFNEKSRKNNSHSNVDAFISPKHSARSNDYSIQPQNHDTPNSASSKLKMGPPKLPVEVERSRNVTDKEIYNNEVSDVNTGMKWTNSDTRGNKIPNLSHFRVPLSDDIVSTPEQFLRANSQRHSNQGVTSVLGYGGEGHVSQNRVNSGQKGIRFDVNHASEQNKIGHVNRKSTPLQQKVINTNDTDDFSEFNEDDEPKDQYNKYDNYNYEYDDLDNYNNFNYDKKTKTRQQNIDMNYSEKNKGSKSKHTLDSSKQQSANSGNPKNKEIPALPCEISLSSGVSSNVGPKDQLYFSKLPREVEYKPYTLEQYKLIKPAEYVEISKMKPDLNSDELIAKRANAERIKEFSKNLRNFNSQMIGNQQKLPSGSESHEIDNAKKKMLSARERALQFAKNIPKPKVNKDSFKSADDVIDLHDDDGYMRVSYEQYGMESKQAKYLEDLEAKYIDSKRNVDAIKRQLK